MGKLKQWIIDQINKLQIELDNTKYKDFSDLMLQERIDTYKEIVE